MCEFVEDIPESYDDVMTSGLNSNIKKRVLLFYQLSFLHTTYFVLYCFFFFFTHIIKYSGHIRQL